ncbi:pro-resilin-like [Trichogramma pretiosum]|uniref:pro-resilin-like n=1 Tax=Trichogramma pretiosum TaxID=7493 RepID=UPI0006C95172|nr:pro-resilin-like [Trichogramma pretiosum]
MIGGALGSLEPSSGYSYEAPPNRLYLPSEAEPPNRSYLPPASGSSSDLEDILRRQQSTYPTADYSFSYAVRDEKAPSGRNAFHSTSPSFYGQQERRHGSMTRGSYHVLLPDGRLQLVEYEADERGFRPRITYKQTGQAKKSVSGAAYATYRRPASAAAADSVPYFPTVSSYRTTTPAYTARSNNLYLYS